MRGSARERLILAKLRRIRDTNCRADVTAAADLLQEVLRQRDAMRKAIDEANSIIAPNLTIGDQRSFFYVLGRLAEIFEKVPNGRTK